MKFADNLDKALKSWTNLTYDQIGIFISESLDLKTRNCSHIVKGIANLFLLELELVDKKDRHKFYERFVIWLYCRLLL